jgi:hypothetical protein
MTVEPVLETLHETLAAARTRPGAPYDPGASPLHGRAIFVVGAPRSGTTWLHQLLAAVDADRDAAALHLVAADGARCLVRLYGDPDRPDRVVVHGSS